MTFDPGYLVLAASRSRSGGRRSYHGSYHSHHGSSFGSHYGSGGGTWTLIVVVVLGVVGLCVWGVRRGRAQD